VGARAGGFALPSYTITGDTTQKLPPHFCEAGAAVFAVEEVEYGEHISPLTKQTESIILSRSKT
jgi:hypothetical protein